MAIAVKTTVEAASREGRMFHPDAAICRKGMKEEMNREKAGHKTATVAEQFQKTATDLNRADNFF